MGRGRVVQDDLKDLRAEEVGDVIGRCAHAGIVRVGRHGGANFGVVNFGVVTCRRSFEGRPSPFDKGLVVFTPVCRGSASIGASSIGASGRALGSHAIGTPRDAVSAGTGLLNRKRHVSAEGQ